MNNKRVNSAYARYIKRILDVFIAVFVLIIFWWVYVIIAAIIKLKLGSPIIFTQDRPGKNGRVFKLYKFRSMSNDRDLEGNLFPDKDRLSKFGRLLRSTSLDELPEIFNMLRGDMSLIGPRPLLTQYLNQYNRFENRRHLVRPGLTGLAQISGRNAATWKSRFERDVYYVENISFLLDLKIFFQTIKKIFIREGVEYTDSRTINDYFESEDRITELK